MRPWPFILIVISLITHLVFFDRPQSVVFDETYQGSFLGYYATGEYYFDVHPPLGRLLIKAVGDISGVDYGASYKAIGDSLSSDIFFLRLLPLLAGILLPLIIYFICRRLSMSELSSFIAGLLICLENSLLVQSKFILTDSLMLLFGFLSILLYLIYIKSGSKKLLVSFILLSAAAFSIKWTGLAFPLLIGIAEVVRLRNFRKILKFFLISSILSLVFYFVIFTIHLSLLTKPGPGDAFMTPDFQSRNMIVKFIDLNGEMYRANSTMTAVHSYSSKWYTWPLMMRPIFYWQNQEEGKYIYLLGNPFIYWLGILSVILLTYYLVFKRGKDKVAWFILVGFLANFLPFVLIGRVMFLYHYQSALVFSILAIVFFVDKFQNRKNKIVLTSLVMLICLSTFIFFAPLSYGLRLDDSALKSRMWFTTWR